MRTVYSRQTMAKLHEIKTQYPKTMAVVKRVARKACKTIGFVLTAYSFNALMNDERLSNMPLFARLREWILRKFARATGY